MQAFQDLNRAAVAEHVVGWVVNSSWNIIGNAIAIGDIARAEARCASDRGNHRGADQRQPENAAELSAQGRSFEADFEAARALIFEAKGQFHDAELATRAQPTTSVPPFRTARGGTMRLPRISWRTRPTATGSMQLA